MADHTLGTVALDLVVNHGAFLTGFSEAGLASRKFRSEFQSAFSGLGEVTNALLAPLGQLGSTISATFSEVGRAGAIAASALSGVGGTLGTLGTVGAIGAGALLAVEAGAVGLALHAAEGAAKMQELSNRTGVSVSTLSVFTQIGKAVGIESEGMAKALSKLSASLFAAATAPEGAKNAFTRLHIAARDAATGGVRTLDDVLPEVITKLAAIENPTVRVALAAQLMGQRFGPQMLQLMSLGGDAIREYAGHLEKLHAVMDPALSAASEKFELKLLLIKAAGEGLTNQLLRALLPSLSLVADKLVGFFESADAQPLIDKVVTLTKHLLVLGEEFILLTQLSRSWLGQTAAVLNELEGTSELAGLKTKAAIDRLVGGEAGAEDLKKNLAAQEAVAKETAARVNESLGGETFGKGVSVADQLNKLDAVKEKIFSLGKPATLFDQGFAPGFLEGFGIKKPGGTDVDLSKTAHAREHRDIIAETIGKLRAQTEEEGALANAISGVTSSTIQNTAAAEAEKTIAETNIKAARDHKTLSEAQKVDIRDLTLLKVAYETAYKDNKGLESFIEKTELQTKSLNELAEAYRIGTPLAIEQAKESAKSAVFEKQAADIRQTIDALHAQGKTYLELTPLITSWQKAMENTAKAKIDIHAGELAQQKLNLEETTRQMDLQTISMKALIPALLGGAAAMREFNIDEAVKAFGEKNPLVDTAAFRDKVTQIEDLKSAASGARLVEGSQPFLGINQQLHDLEILKAAEEEAGRDTIAIDTLIYQTKNRYLESYMTYWFDANNKQLLGDAKLLEAQLGLVRQWDQAALAVGKFGDVTQAVMNEIWLKGQDTAKKIAEAFLGMVDSINSSLAKALTGGKAESLKQIFQGFAEKVVKAQLESMEAKVAGAFGVKLGGTKPDGSPSNPLYMILTNHAQLAAAHAAEQTKGAGGWLGKIGSILLGKSVGPGNAGTAGASALLPDGTQTNPFYVVTLTGAGFGAVGTSGAGGYDLSSIDKMLGIKGAGTESADGTDSNPWKVNVTNTRDFASAMSSLFSGGPGGGGTASKLIGILSNALTSTITAKLTGPTTAPSSAAAVSAEAYALGGDISAGKYATVGEQGPEFIFAQHDLSVVPMSRMQSGRGHQSNVTINVNGVRDSDMFRRSESQIRQAFHQQLSIANSRA